MNTGKPIAIIALGKYLPEKVDSNSLEEKYDIPKGWSEEKSGVQSRHQITFESSGYMGARAIEKALLKSQLQMKDIDMIISAAATFDYILPNQASIIKSELKNCLHLNTATIDINTTCLSFISAFELASKLLDGKQYKNIIIVSSEISSKGLDPDNWETFTLFGDGAVAAVLQYDENSDSRFIKGGQRTYSEGVEFTIIKGGGNKYFFKDYPYDQQLHSFKMNGIKLLKLAKTKLPEFIDSFFEDLSINILDTNVIIPHQASKIGLMLFNRLYNFREGQVKENLKMYGNCIAASIPLVLHDTIESGEIKRGDLCFLIGTSAGFSIGGVLFKY
jgi:3-oxoacyl-[acyl-carrier-protein] synthase-3